MPSILSVFAQSFISCFVPSCISGFVYPIHMRFCLHHTYQVLFTLYIPGCVPLCISDFVYPIHIRFCLSHTYQVLFTQYISGFANPTHTRLCSRNTCIYQAPFTQYTITKTCPCNIQRLFSPVKTENFIRKF